MFKYVLCLTVSVRCVLPDCICMVDYASLCVVLVVRCVFMVDCARCVCTWNVLDCVCRIVFVGLIVLIACVDGLCFVTLGCFGYLHTFLVVSKVISQIFIKYSFKIYGHTLMSGNYFYKGDNYRIVCFPSGHLLLQ